MTPTGFEAKREAERGEGHATAPAEAAIDAAPAGEVMAKEMVKSGVMNCRAKKSPTGMLDAALTQNRMPRYEKMPVMK